MTTETLEALVAAGVVGERLGSRDLELLRGLGVPSHGSRSTVRSELQERL